MLQSMGSQRVGHAERLNNDNNKFSDNIGNPGESARKLLEVTTKLSTVAGYKMDTQNSSVFPYTSKQSKRNVISNSL